MKIQVLYMELKIYFSLIQPLCQISKKLYSESTPWNNLSTALRDQNKPDTHHVVESTEVINSIINIHLRLMIFNGMHSKESQFHNKCLFCSIKSIIYVQIPHFVVLVNKSKLTRCGQVQVKVQTKSSKSYITVRRNMSNDV